MIFIDWEGGLTMSRSLVLLYVAGTLVFAAGSPDLLVAIRNGDYAQVQRLLRAGADAKATNKRSATPMNVAVLTYGSTPVLNLLMAKGAELEPRMMISVAQKGDLEAIRYLLSVGVSPGDATGATISAALTARCQACVRLLVENGAPVSGLRSTGQGVLNDAAKRSMTGIAEYLLDHGAETT